MAGQNLGFPKLIASWLQSSQAERKAWLFVRIDMMINYGKHGIYEKIYNSVDFWV